MFILFDAKRFSSPLDARTSAHFFASRALRLRVGVCVQHGRHEGFTGATTPTRAATGEVDRVARNDCGLDLVCRGLTHRVANTPTNLLVSLRLDGADRRPPLEAAHFFGLTNRNVMRSLSPIAAYFARSLSPSSNVGGNVHTPSG